MPFSFIRAINKDCAAVCRLTLSDLTFASPMPKGKTREDLLAVTAWPHQHYKQGEEDTVQHPKGIELWTHSPTSFLITTVHSMPSPIAQRSALLQVKKRAWNCPIELYTA
jgi:hypothetical protein